MVLSTQELEFSSCELSSLVWGTELAFSAGTVYVLNLCCSSIPEFR